MIKVCIVSLYAYRLFDSKDEKSSPFSGSEIQQYYLGRELAKDNNYKVSFIVGDFNKNQPKYKEVFFDTNVIHLFKSVNCGKRNILIDGIGDFWKLYRVMKRISADIYIIRGGGSFAGKVAFIAKTVLKKKFVYSSAHDRDSNGGFLKNHSWLVRRLFRNAINSANIVICQHEGQLVAFKNNLNVNAKVIKSMYPIETELPVYNQTRNFILWVGRLVTWKQPDLFIRLARQFPDEKFLLITNSDITELKKTVPDMNNLEVQQNVPLEDMDNHFRKAKLFINTSAQEGFPNTFVQATKNATPILSLHVDPDKMFEKYDIGRYAHGDFNQLTNNTRLLLDRDDLWYTSSKGAYYYAKENHDIAVIIQSFKEIFLDLNK